MRIKFGVVCSEMDDLDKARAQVNMQLLEESRAEAVYAQWETVKSLHPDDKMSSFYLGGLELHDRNWTVAIECFKVGASCCKQSASSSTGRAPRGRGRRGRALPKRNLSQVSGYCVARELG